jgi:hypothetical protein
MKKTSDYQTIEMFGIKLTVHYILNGIYIPATHYQPEEHPDLIIDEILVDNMGPNLYNLFTEDQIEDIANIVKSYL